MEQVSNPGNENHTITWKKACLYAFGWLICGGVLGIPLVAKVLTLNGDDPLLIVILAGLILLTTVVIITAKIVHHSWRVSISSNRIIHNCRHSLLTCLYGGLWVLLQTRFSTKRKIRII